MDVKHAELLIASSPVDHAPIRPPKQLSDLAPETVLQIFKSISHPGTITALASTSRKFYDIWRPNTARISREVLPRYVFGYDYAMQVYFLQHRRLALHMVTSRDYFTTILRNKILLENARVVDQQYRQRAYYRQTSSWSLAIHTPRTLESFTHEYGKFTRNFYQIWALALLQYSPSCKCCKGCTPPSAIATRDMIKIANQLERK